MLNYYYVIHSTLLLITIFIQHHSLVACVQSSKNTANKRKRRTLVDRRTFFLSSEQTILMQTTSKKNKRKQKRPRSGEQENPSRWWGHNKKLLYDTIAYCKRWVRRYNTGWHWLNLGITVRAILRRVPTKSTKILHRMGRTAVLAGLPLLVRAYAARSARTPRSWYPASTYSTSHPRAWYFLCYVYSHQCYMLYVPKYFAYIISTTQYRTNHRT